MSIMVDASDLRRCLSNALLFAGDDETLPVLMAVKIEMDEQTFTAVATDRYTLAADTCEASGDPLAAVIPAADVRRIIAALPRKSGPKAIVTVEGHTYTVTFGGTVLSGDVVEAEFPRWRGLMPDMSTEPSAPIPADWGFTAAYLARFGKVQPVPSFEKTMRMRFTAARSPIGVVIGDTFRGLIMPVNIAA